MADDIMENGEEKIFEEPQDAAPSPKKKEKKPKKKNKKLRKKVKKIVFWVVLLLIVVAVVFVLPRFMKKEAAALGIYKGDIYIAEQKGIEKTISATGLVESHEDTTAKVYSTLNYKIDTVNVSVGDKVSEGDVLCVYDTETLDRAIREKELGMSSSARSASYNLANAKHNYESYKNGIDTGTNSAVVNAQSAYDTAVENYENAVEDYEEYLAKSDNAEIIALNAAKRDLDKAQSDYDDYLSELENGGNTTLSTAKRNLDKAQSDYDALKKELEEGTNLELTMAQRSVDTARDNYEDYKELVDNDDTAELMSAAAALDQADAKVDEAVALRNTYKQAMEEAEEEWESVKDDPDVSDIDKNKAEQRYKIAKGKYDSQCTAVERLREQNTVYEDAYDRAYDAADITLKSYKTAYDNAVDNYNAVKEGLDDKLAAYEKALGDAKDNYNAAKSNTDTQLENYESALRRAEDAYETALENSSDQLEAYEDAVTRAERNMNDAKVTLDNAKSSSDDQLESYRIAYRSAQNNTNTDLADYQLANLYQDLKKTSVEAPISGTVTAVYAVEGETLMNGGVMFVVEDTENLVITSTVKAYDLGKVEVGMPVNIKTDATGDTVYRGVIESIAPTAVKDAAGNIISTNDAEFETVVKVMDTTGALRIGVSAKIEYVIEADEDAIVIPESAVLTDDKGSYVILAKDKGENRVELVRADVTVGINDGIYVSVTGISAQDAVLDNAESYKGFIGKTLAVSETDMNSQNNGMADMMAMGPMGR